MTNKTWTMEHQAGPALSGRAIRGLAEFPGRCPGLTNGCAFSALALPGGNFTPGLDQGTCIDPKSDY